MICRECGKDKLAEEFYPRQRKCKECTKARVRANYAKNREHYAEYERERFKRPERKAAALRYQSIRRSEQVVKSMAWNKVSNAIRDGRLFKQSCEVCGLKEVEAHHEDYSKPLEVRWLCRVHHLEHHGKVAYSTLDKEEAA